MATAALLEKFRAFFPEFSVGTYPDTTIDFYLDLAGNIFSACQNAQLFLSAHLLASDVSSGIGIAGGSVVPVSPDGGNGEHTSEKVGDISVNMMAMAERGLDTSYTDTAYGRRYMQLKNACASYNFSIRVSNGFTGVL